MVIDGDNSRKSEHTAKDRCEDAGTHKSGSQSPYVLKTRDQHLLQTDCLSGNKVEIREMPIGFLVFIQILSHLESDTQTPKSIINKLFKNQYEKH